MGDYLAKSWYLFSQSSLKYIDLDANFYDFLYCTFFTSKRKCRKCIFGRASIGFGRILQQRPDKSLPYKYPHTLMNALCYHPKKSDIRNFSSCEKIFFSNFVQYTFENLKGLQSISISSYMPLFIQYITFEFWNLLNFFSEYKYQNMEINKDRQLHYNPTTQHEKRLKSKILQHLNIPTHVISNIQKKESAQRNFKEILDNFYIRSKRG